MTEQIGFRRSITSSCQYRFYNKLQKSRINQLTLGVLLTNQLTDPAFSDYFPISLSDHRILNDLRIHFFCFLRNRLLTAFFQTFQDRFIQ